MVEILYKGESYTIQGIAYDIYKEFRNRHKEKIYLDSFYWSLKDKGMQAEKEKRIDIFYNGRKVGTYIPDLVVNNNIFIELKVKPFLSKDDIKQFWYYLKATKYKVGFLINFGSSNGVEFIRRVYDSARKK